MRQRSTAVAETVDRICLTDAVVVGHNVEFDLGFFNAELKRVGRPPMVNERVDTLALATTLLPGLRKPTLQRAGRAARVAARQPRTRHRAGPDAALTGAVAVALLEQARDAGFHSLDDLKAVARPVTRRPRERMPRASSVVDRSMLATIPRAPGVYLMRDANEHVVYVGKAKNLRDRVGTYFSQPLGYTRKMDGLIESLSRIQVEVVGSELEALLLESQLIRRYQPRYNTALRSHEQYPFIRIDVSNPWPRVSLAKARKDDGARYFGPFRSAATARKTVDLINRVVPLRTCTALVSGRAIVRIALSSTRSRSLPRALRGARGSRPVHGAGAQVVDYVDGRDEALHEVLWSGLEDAAAALDFERASRLRRDLQASLALTAAQRRLRESTEANWVLLVTRAAEPEYREVMVILRGRLWSQLRVDGRSRTWRARLAARDGVGSGSRSWARRPRSRFGRRHAHPRFLAGAARGAPGDSAARDRAVEPDWRGAGASGSWRCDGSSSTSTPGARRGTPGRASGVSRMRRPTGRIVADA